MKRNFQTKCGALITLVLAQLLMTACASGPTNSVGYTTIWNRSLVDNKYQLPQAMIRTSDGGYAVSGYGSVELVPNGVGSQTGFWTIKLDRNGKVVWQRAFAAESPKRQEEGHALAQTRDGGILVVGTTNSDSLAGRPLGVSNHPQSGSTSRIGFAIKYSANGTLLWKKAIANAEEQPSDWFYAVGSIESGYVLAGKSSAISNGNNVVWALRMLKLDEGGEVVWDRTIPDGEFSIRSTSISRKIVTTSDGGFIVAIAPTDVANLNARRMSIESDDGKLIGTAPMQRVVMLKIGSNGNLVKRVELPEATEHLALGSNASGYIVSGYYKLLWYALFDSHLNLKWRRAVTPAMKINAFYSAPDGGFYGAGATSQAAFCHITPSGELRQRTVSGMPDDTEGRDIASGDQPDEIVVLWSRIPQTRAGLLKIQIRTHQL